MNKDSMDDGGNVDRRDFLKKAGVVAWTIPAMQVVNMGGALAGVDGVNTSVTTTTVPPTTLPPRCEDFYYRLKADLTDGGWVWIKGQGENDCIKGDYLDLVPDGIPLGISGDAESATVKHELENCEIVKAYHKAGSPNQGEACFEGQIGDGGSYATFTAQQHGISHVELIIKCCVRSDAR